MYDPTLSSKSEGEPSSSRRAIYVAPLVHSLSLDELEFSDLSAISVDEDGIIEWVHPIDGSLSRKGQERVLEGVRAKYGGAQDEVETVWLEEGFICPGLIDTHTVSPPN